MGSFEGKSWLEWHKRSPKDKQANMRCAIGSPVPQRGIITYGLSPNRQKLWGNMTENAQNTFRRIRGNILYFTPFVVYYFIHQWANERYVRSRPTISPRLYRVSR